MTANTFPPCGSLADCVETLFPALAMNWQRVLSEVPEASIGFVEDLFNAVTLDNVLDWTSCGVQARLFRP